MRRSQFEKIYFGKQTNESLRPYKKQKNYSTKLYENEEKNSLITIFKLKILTIKKVLTIKNSLYLPFFTNKGSFARNVKLIEKDEILKDDTF